MSENVLTTKQARAVAALLVSRTQGEAAAAAGISTKQLARWLADPAFRAALAMAEQEAVDLATRRLAGLLGMGVDTLQSILEDNTSDRGTQLRAVAMVADIFSKLAERRLDARLTALEAVIYDAQSKNQAAF